MAHNTQIMVVMVAYLGLLIAWGLYQGRKVKSDSDYASEECIPTAVYSLD